MPALNEADVERLRDIKTFPSLVKYLRDELDWPIESDDFEDIVFDFTPEELELDLKTAAKVDQVKQLRPLVTDQNWGIFFVKFAPGRLPVVALRRILSKLIIKKRASANKVDRAAWNKEDLLFISNYGEGEQRQITFAHFTDNEHHGDLPTLKVLGWDNDDTALHLDDARKTLGTQLRWPEDPSNLDAWRKSWAGAFTTRYREAITTSKQLALALAELAANIRKRCNAALKIEKETGPLKKLMAAFQKALIHDLQEDDFADMYAQTIAYGLLSARISRTAADDDHGALVADNVADMVPITNPFLKELMETFLHLGGRRGRASQAAGLDFDELGINDVVEMLRQANMKAVLVDFGNRNPAEDPVIHFYELFLKEYDAQKRMQRGVFYTPLPVVSYIVRSVHELLQTEFGLEDGLADTSTWAAMLMKHEGLKLPEIEVVDPDTRQVSKKPIDPSTPFVQILDPATGTATFLVEVINVIHKTMTDKWKKASVPELARFQKWNEYVPKHLLPRLHGYELMMAPYAIAHMKIGLKLFETGYKFGSGERARIYLTNALEPPHDFSDTFEQMAPALAHEAKTVNDVKRHQRFTVVIGNPPYANYSANLSPDARRIVDKYRNYRGAPIRERNQLQFERNIQDDFVKFISIAQELIDASCAGVFSYITNATMLASTSLRGLRESLMGTFNSLFEMNLHGGGNEIIAGADDDENVFDIVQAVAIHLYVRSKVGGTSEVSYADLLGRRELKYSALLSASVERTKWQGIRPDAENSGFLPQDEAGIEGACRLDSAFVKFGAGIKTNRDAVVIGLDEASLLETVRQYDNGLVTGKQAREYIRPLLYRPFDFRRVFYHEDAVFSRSLPTMKHVLAGPNIGFICSSTWTTPDRFSVGISRIMVEMKSGTHDRGTTFFPLYRYESPMGGKPERIDNLARDFVEEWCSATGTQFVADEHGDGERTSGPEDVLHWLYGLFYSPEYRRRFRAALSQRFPIVLLTSNRALLRSVIRLGGELASLHLLESPKLSQATTRFICGSQPEVEKISWSKDTVWLDKKQTCGFAGVPEAVWNFHIGGYQVCEKWLKDRKGRTLSKDDIAHYGKIIVSISETIRLMKEIDETIDKHGGWPGAFVTTPLTLSTGASPVSMPSSQASSAADESASSNGDGEKSARPRYEQPPELSDEDEATLDAIWDRIGQEKSAAKAQGDSDEDADRPVAITEVERDEILAVIRDVFSDGQVRERDDAIAEVARAMGYERVGSRIREEVDNSLRTAVRRMILDSKAGNLWLLTRQIGDYTRDDLIQLMLSDITGWWDQDELIRATARYLGFRRTGRNIAEAFKSAINGAIRRGLLERDGDRLRKV